MPYPKGQCRGCGGKPEPRRAYCEPCLARRRAQDELLRQERRAKKRCLTCGDPAERQRRYCARHLEYYRRRDAVFKATRR